MTDGHDLGHGVTAWFVVDEDERIVMVAHDHPAGNVGPCAGVSIYGDGRCGGAMPLAGRAEGVVWDITQGDPDTGFDNLTLTPSSLCRACGHHGWITNGRWVEA